MKKEWNRMKYNEIEWKKRQNVKGMGQNEKKVRQNEKRMRQNEKRMIESEKSETEWKKDKIDERYEKYEKKAKKKKKEKFYEKQLFVFFLINLHGLFTTSAVLAEEQ